MPVENTGFFCFLQIIHPHLSIIPAKAGIHTIRFGFSIMPACSRQVGNDARTGEEAVCQRLKGGKIT